MTTAPSLFRREFAANLAGTGVAAGCWLVFAPTYTRLIGVAGFAFIGFFMALQTAVQVFDFGLSLSVNRELSRSAAGPPSLTQRRLLRGIETLTVAIGLLLGAALTLLAEVIARRWLTLDDETLREGQLAIVLMAVLITVQWPTTLYRNGLLGAGHAVAMNSERVVFVVLAHACAVAGVSVRPQPSTFFLVFIAAGAVELIVLRLMLWRVVGGRHGTAAFDMSEVRHIWKLAVGLTALSAVALVVSQADKLLLSGILALGTFGAYSIGSLVASAMFVLIAPFFATIFPRFASQIAQQRTHDAAALYESAVAAASLSLLPLGASLLMFGRPLMELWFAGTGAAPIAGPVAGVLACGNALNGIANAPFALHLAAGRTRPILVTAAILAVPYVIAVLMLGKYVGPVSAALAWVGFNTLYLAALLSLAGRLLPGQRLVWRAIRRILPPAIAVILASLIVPFILPTSIRSWSLSLVSLLATYAAITVGLTILWERFYPVHIRNC
jgi:O-antigen/teichoic acid export membrane protein